MCAGTMTGQAQSNNYQEVRFRYLHAYTQDYFLSETTQYGDVPIRAELNNPATFTLDPLGAGHYLIMSGARYLFANAKSDWGFEFTHGGFDEANGYFGGDVKNTGKLLAVYGVRFDNILYVGDLVKAVVDAGYSPSSFDRMAQQGDIKKIDLTKINNFAFSFLKYNTWEGKDTYIINSDIGAIVQISDRDAFAVISDGSSSSVRLSSFFIESENQFVPVESDYDGQFGENGALNWELKDGTLTVSGTGSIPSDRIPWNAYSSSITNIIITTGITAVEAQGFYECENLLSLTLPQSIVSIGAGAFSYSNKLASVTVNWTGEEDLPAIGAGAFRNISSGAVLNVPAGTKAVYEAADPWKNFKTIREQSMTAQPTPIRNSRGSFSLSLAVPETGTFTAVFDVLLPAKFDLNTGATRLMEALSNSFNLKIAPKGSGVWSFVIEPKATRSASASPLREIVDVVYDVEKTLEDGNYELKVNDIDLTLADGTVIHENEIAVPVSFNSATNTERIAVTAVWSAGGRLHITSPAATTLSVFTVTGSLQKQQTIPAGNTIIALPAGVYIVKVGDTVKKIIIR
jgi:hypothetical protein